MRLGITVGIVKAARLSLNFTRKKKCSSQMNFTTCIMTNLNEFTLYFSDDDSHNMFPVFFVQRFLQFHFRIYSLSDNVDNAKCMVRTNNNFKPSCTRKNGR